MLHCSPTHETIIAAMATTRSGTSEISNGWVSGCGPAANGARSASAGCKFSLMRIRALRIRHLRIGRCGLGHFRVGIGRLRQGARAVEVFVFDMVLAVVVLPLHDEQRQHCGRAEDVDPEPGRIGHSRWRRRGGQDAQCSISHKPLRGGRESRSSRRLTSRPPTLDSWPPTALADFACQCHPECLLLTPDPRPADVGVHASACRSSLKAELQPPDLNPRPSWLPTALADFACQWHPRVFLADP